MILSSRVEEAAAAGDYPLALRLVNQIMDMSGELVADQKQHVYYPVWRRAVQLLRSLPAAGAKVYEQLYNAEVATRFSSAQRVSNLGELRELFRRYPLAADWGAVGVELVAQYLENGLYADALAVLRELESSGVPPTIESRAQHVVALAMIGSNADAVRRLAALESDTEGGAIAPPQRDAVKRVRNWLDQRIAGATGAESGGLAPLLGAALPWRAALDGVDGALALSNDAAANAVGYQRALPLISAALDGDTVALRSRGVLWAIDTMTMTRRWQIAEPRFQELQTHYNNWPGAAGGGDDDTPDPNLPPEARALLRGAAQHAISAAAGLVFTIEPRPGSDAEPSTFQQQFMFPPVEPVQPNVLVARDISSGQTEWRLGADPADAYYGASFQDAPLAVDERLLVLARLAGPKQELGLVALDPRSGKTLARVPIVGPPIFLPMDGGRCMLIADETTLYITTGNGVVAALERASFAWKWAATYGTTNARRNHWFPWGGNADDEPRREYSIDPPVLAADVLVVAPIDSSDIIAFDRFDGRQRWRVERRDSTALLGAVADGILLGGSTINCVDPADGTTLRWRSVALELTGRIATDGRSVFVPTRGGVLTLNGRDGRVIAAQNLERIAPPTDTLTANLVVANGSILALGPNDVTKYPDPTAVRAVCEKRLAADAKDARAQLALAWLRTLEQDYAGALHLLENLDAADQAVVAARDSLLSTTFVALSRGSGGAEERLRWLRRAAALPLGEESASDLAILVGRTLEEAQRWGEALEHYKGVLLRPRAGALVPVGDGAYRRAAWVDALARMRFCLTQASPAEGAAFYTELTADAIKSGDALLLERARRAIGARPARDELDRALLLAGAPPELAIDFINSGGTTSDAAERARLHLERWEIHVALGMLDAARADREVWQRDFGARTSRPADENGDDPEAKRVEKIDRAMRKLEQAQDGPFDEEFYRSWIDNQCELVLDAALPRRVPGMFVLTRDLGNRKIVLRSGGGDRRRETPDAIKGMAAPKIEDSLFANIVVQNNESNAPPTRPCWPSAVYQQRAVVPVRGGLACIGLGPERAGGKLLWDYATGWIDIPTDCFEHLAAGPEGVCVVPRGGRVELLSWMDGRPRWARELGSVTVKRVLAASKSILVFTDDSGLLSIDAEFGERVTRWSTSNGAVQRALLIDDVLVVRSDETVAAYDPDTLDRKWTVALQATQCEPVAGRPWVLIRPKDVEWAVLDVHTGRPVLHPSVHMDDSIMSVAADDRLFLVATQTERNSGRTRESHIQAFELDTGKHAFTVDVDDTTEVNATQLIGHERFVPLLTVSRGDSRREGAPSPLQITLIDKRDGHVLPPRDIDRDFPTKHQTCGPLLIASPTRMYVQAYGTTTAYGNTGK